MSVRFIEIPDEGTIHAYMHMYTHLPTVRRRKHTLLFILVVAGMFVRVCSTFKFDSKKIQMAPVKQNSTIYSASKTEVLREFGILCKQTNKCHEYNRMEMWFVVASCFKEACSNSQ